MRSRARGVVLRGRPREAQIYTRKNANGVVEATNVPDAHDYRLTYPGKGTLIHSRAYRLRPSYNGEFNHHIAAAAALHGVRSRWCGRSSRWSRTSTTWPLVEGRRRA